MALIALSLVRRSFDLVFELPDRVVRWIGHHGEQLGEHQDEPESARRFFAAYARFSGMGIGKGIKIPGFGGEKTGSSVENVKDLSGGGKDKKPNKN